MRVFDRKSSDLSSWPCMLGGPSGFAVTNASFAFSRVLFNTRPMHNGGMTMLVFFMLLLYYLIHRSTGTIQGKLLEHLQFHSHIFEEGIFRKEMNIHDAATSDNTFFQCWKYPLCFSGSAQCQVWM